MTDSLSAICSCGERVTVEHPRRGQSLYGTLAGHMARHEQVCASNNGQGWAFDHPHDVPEISQSQPSYRRLR